MTVDSEIQNSFVVPPLLSWALGQHWAVHQSRFSSLQQTSSSVNIFSWSISLVWGIVVIFHKGPYFQNKKTRTVVHAAQQVRKSCAALNMFIDSSSSQLCSLNLELMQPLPDFLFCNQLWKGFISSWLIPVTLRRAGGMKINLSLTWLFYNCTVLTLRDSSDLSATTSHTFANFSSVQAKVIQLNRINLGFEPLVSSS